MTPDADTSTQHYTSLLLPPGSSPQQVHAQYRRLAKEFHPDRNPERREWAEERLRGLNAAYQALTRPDAVPAPPAVAEAAAPPPPAAAETMPPAPRSRSARRALRYVAVIAAVCGVSVAYSSGVLSPSAAPAPESVGIQRDDSAVAGPAAPGTVPAASPDAREKIAPVLGTLPRRAASPSGTFPDNSAPSVSTLPDSSAPAAGPFPYSTSPASGAAPDDSAAPAHSLPDESAASAHPLPDESTSTPNAAPDSAAPQYAPQPVPAPPAAANGAGESAALAAQFRVENVGLDAAVARARQITGRVNRETQHAPQSLRPQKAEQLAADAQALLGLQHAVQSGLRDLQAPTLADLRRAQVSGLRLALAQMHHQRQLVEVETASFPAK